MAKIHQGLNTGADDVFLMREMGRTFIRVVFAKSPVNGKTVRLEADMTRTIIRGRNIKGYQLPPSHNFCVLPCDSTGCLLPEHELRTQFPRVYQYLVHCRSRLAHRPTNRGEPWYTPWCGNLELFQRGPRLISSKISSPAGFTLIDDSTIVCHNSVVVIVPDPSKIDPHCLLGILNSQVFWRFLRLTTPYMGTGRQVLRLSDVRRFPIPWPLREEQRYLCNLIGGLTQKALSGGEIDILQKQIDALTNRLFEPPD